MRETSHAPPASGKTRRIHELDLLRFITAMAVVLNHYTFNGPAKGTTPYHYPEISSLTKYGFIGVEMFFLISGFVIPMSVRNSSLKHFIASRVTRLYPAFWAACTLTFLTITLWGRPTYTASFTQYLVNMTMFSGFFQVESIDAVYHTLFVEIVWYAIVAAILAAAVAHRRGGAAILLAAAPAVILMASGLSAGLLGVQPLGTPAKAFIGAYWMYFVAGYLFYVVWSHKSRPVHLILLVICWLGGVASSQRYVANVQEDVGVAVNPWVLAGLVTACFLAMGMVATERTPIQIRKRNWAALGALTYPLYLVHQVIGMVILRSLGTTVGRWTALAITTSAALGLAQLIHTGIEKPSVKPLRRITLAALDRMLPARPAQVIAPGRHRRVTG